MIHDVQTNIHAASYALQPTGSTMHLCAVRCGSACGEGTVCVCVAMRMDACELHVICDLSQSLPRVEKRALFAQG